MPSDLRKSAEDTAADYTEHELRVGPGGARRQRFVGRRLGDYRHFTKQGIAVLTVYQGRTGKFVIHRQESDWADASSVVANWTKGLKQWRDVIGLGEDGWGEFTSEVVDSIGELRGRVPEKLYRTVIDVVEHPATQVLDI